jgi:hypothetical protein
MTTSARDAWGTTLFADDIRFEVAGKYSVIGIYNIDMVLPIVSFPVSIPKFCVLVKYQEIKGAFKDDIVVKIYFPGDPKDNPSFTNTIPKETRETTDAAPTLEEGEERILNITLPIIFSPLTIKEEGIIKVRVECGGNTIKLGRLVIRAVDSAEMPAPAG